MFASPFVFGLSTNEVKSPFAPFEAPSDTCSEIEKNSKCLISMPSEHTCTVTPPGTSPLKHAKSHYSLQATRASTPTSPIKARSRAGTPVGGRPSSAGGDWDAAKMFTFDHCLWSVDSADEGFAGQEKLYEVLGEEFLNHSLEGYNCCIFACSTSYIETDSRRSNWIWKNTFHGC
jgi:hypothetical protein